MLAFFRRQKWLWVVLIAVFSFALVVGLVPMGQLDHVHFTTDIARVGTEAVSASEFQTSYYNAVNQMGAGVTPEILAAIGFETQVIDQLVNQYSMIAEAKTSVLAVPRSIARSLENRLNTERKFMDSLSATQSRIFCAKNSEAVLSY